jgi:hypothetical protein
MSEHSEQIDIVLRFCSTGIDVDPGSATDYSEIFRNFPWFHSNCGL